MINLSNTCNKQDILRIASSQTQCRCWYLVLSFCSINNIFHTYLEDRRNEKLTKITLIAVIKCKCFQKLNTLPNSNFFVSAEMQPRVNVTKIDKHSSSNLFLLEAIFDVLGQF